MKKISYAVGLSTQILTYDYYFADTVLIYVVEKEHHFLEIENDTDGFIGWDYSKIKPGFEGHYYWKNNKIILKEEGGERRFGKVDMNEKEKELLDDVRRFTADLNNKGTKLIKSN